MNILVVSPAYAPYAGVGANRMMSFTQYMVGKGHRIIVLRNAPHLWPPETLKSSPPEGVEVRDVEATGDFDHCVEAYYSVLKVVYRDNKIDCALYSCNPYYTIVAADKIKRENGAKYIIDFRDLWIKDEALTRSILRRIKKYIVRIPYRKYEKRCIASADHIVTVTPRDCARLKRQYPVYAKKMSVIFNGYDEERLKSGLTNAEYQNVEAILRSLEGYHTIGVFGKFGYYDIDYVKQLLIAVKELNEEGIPIKIVHIGELDRKSQSAMTRTSFPSELYFGTGFLDYTTGIEVLRNVTMNCLIVHYKRGLGTKIFDYIYLDKPIVFFAPKDSSIADVLKPCKNAFICNNSESAKMAVHTIVGNKMNTLASPNRAMYSRTIQNMDYEKIVKTVIGEEKL